MWKKMNIPVISIIWILFSLRWLNLSKVLFITAKLYVETTREGQVKFSFHTFPQKRLRSDKGRAASLTVRLLRILFPDSMESQDMIWFEKEFHEFLAPKGGGAFVCIFSSGASALRSWALAPWPWALTLGSWAVSLALGLQLWGLWLWLWGLGLYL